MRNEEKWKIQIREKERRRREAEKQGVSTREKIVTNIKESVEDAAISGAQSTALEFGDEISGATMAAYKKATGDQRPVEEIYKEYKEAVQSKVEDARKRSPLASFTADMLAPNPLKLLKAGPVITGVTQAIGGADENIVESAAIGTAVGTGAKVVGKAIGAGFKDPQSTEARFLGIDNVLSKGSAQSGTEWTDEIRKTMDKMRQKGLFKQGSSYSPKANKWRGGKALKSDDIDQIDRKLNDALASSSEEVDKIIRSKGPFTEDTLDVLVRPPKPVTKQSFEWEPGKVSPTVRTEKVQPKFKPDFDKLKSQHIYPKKDIVKYKNKNGDSVLDIAEDLSAPNIFGVEAKDEIDSAIRDSIKNLVKDRDSYTLLDLQQEKQRLYKILQGDYANANLKDAEKETMKRLARLYKDMVNELSGDPRIAELNETMEDVFKIKDAVAKKVEQKFGSSPAKNATGTAVGSTTYRTMKLGERLIDPSRPARAGIRRGFDAMPGMLRQHIEGAASAAPGRVIERMGRQPQSLPEQLVRTKFPRSTDELVQNKDLFLAKLAQEAPDLFQVAQDIFNNSPEDISEVIPALTQVAPHLFNRDKYDRFDNIVLTPAAKMLARKDIMKDDRLSNTDKIEKINLLNKTGELYDY